jgi:hypothetical protein
MPPLNIWANQERGRRLTGHVKFVHVTTTTWREGTKHSVVLKVEETWEQAEWDATYGGKPPADVQWEVREAWRWAQPIDMASPALRWLLDGPKKGLPIPESYSPPSPAPLPSVPFPKG